MHELAVGFYILDQVGALNPQNRIRILIHAHMANSMASAIVCLHQNDIYSDSNWKLLDNHPENAFKIATSFSCLHGDGIFTEENKQTIYDLHTRLNPHDSEELRQSLLTLHWRKNLTQENFNKLIAEVKSLYNVDDVKIEDENTNKNTPKFSCGL